jgi:hypothetical protein
MIRHLRDDRTMGCFDFGIQFLDPDRMTYWGTHRDASFWIENANVESSEAEASFHTVARLTLLPRSRLGPEDSDATYFDVTGHSTPDSTLGSINRARWPPRPGRRSAGPQGEPVETEHRVSRPRER